MMLTRFKKSATQPYGYLEINEFTKKNDLFTFYYENLHLKLTIRY